MRDSKVIFLIESLGGGGAERVISSLASAISGKYDVEVIVWSTACSYQMPKSVRITNIYGYSIVRQIFFIRRYILDNNPSLVFTVLPSASLRMLVVRLFSFRQPTKWLVNLHTVWSKEQHFSNGWLSDILRPILFRLVGIFADKVVTISEEAKHDLAALWSFDPQKISVIKNGIDKNRILAKIKEEVPSGVFCSGIPSIITVGRICAPKNHACLLDAFNAVCKKQRCRLVIIGEGPLKPNLQKQAETYGIASDVVFLPFQENPWKYIAASDVFVLSSIFEGYPLVLLEAMLCKTPIVTTRWGAALDEITMGVNVCVTVENGDCVGMADAILMLLANPQVADSNKQSAFIHASQSLLGAEETVLQYSRELAEMI